MRRQRGQAIVLIALMLTILIGMAAIAIDGSRAYSLRRDLQAAVDAASLAAGDRLQQTGSWSSAEQAAANVFAANLRLYTAPSCGPWSSPGAAPYTVTCTYSDGNGTTLKEVVQGLGPQGSQFTVSAQSNLQLQFARILTNGASPAIASVSTGDVNNQRDTPAFGALDGAGCGPGTNAISINGSGTLGVTGDIVSNGTISVGSGAVRVAGDIYARCQSPVPGAVTNACYPSGASAPCGYPDVAGATRSGFRLVDPNFPAPNVTGGGQGTPSGNVVLSPGVYSFPATLSGAHCWFLSGGVYELQLGAQNLGDVVSNELKPPGEPNLTYPNVLATPQFWNTNGANCAGGFDLTKIAGPRDIQVGIWSFVVTSVRTDAYNGVNYQRKSAPSQCQFINLNNHFDNVTLSISNVPGATSYNIYASPPPNPQCAGPYGLAANVPVTGPVTNTNTNPCPIYTGGGCSLGNESILLSSQLASPWAPSGAPPGTIGSAPPDSETAPLAPGLPNQNPARAAGTHGDRANENSCETIGGARTSCPAAITPGAVELYFPGGACFVNSNGGDTYVFSGAQYDWVSLYEPPGSACANTFGAASDSAYIGLIYTPSARNSITSAVAFESAGSGGMIADTITFTGPMPTTSYNPSYAPVPPASRITS